MLPPLRWKWSSTGNTTTSSVLFCTLANFDEFPVAPPQELWPLAWVWLAGWLAPGRLTEGFIDSAGCSSFVSAWLDELDHCFGDVGDVGDVGGFGDVGALAALAGELVVVWVGCCLEPADACFLPH